MPQNCPEFHCHIQSLDTGSTPEKFALREVALGTGTLTDTDHGSMASCITALNLAKKHKLVPILGMEGYLQDLNDPVLLSVGMDGDSRKHLKYTHFTCHYLDQNAYETGAKLLSRARYERHGSESKPLFSWKDMEELGATNTTFGSGCLIGAVARSLMVDRPDLAQAYYEYYRSLVKPNHFYAEIFPHRCTHNWVHGVFIKTNVTTHKFYSDKKLKTDGKPEVTAEDLSKEFKKGKHTKLLGIFNNRVLADVEETLETVEFIEDFVQNTCTVENPTGDVQLTANRFMLEMARKHGDPWVWSGDSHIATPEDKIVQDVRLAQSGNWRFHTSYHRQTGDELAVYAKDVMGMSDLEIETGIMNTIEWGSRFKDFRLEYKPSLPGKFYPEDSLGYTFELIAKRGRMRWDDPVYADRLKKEIDMIHRNGTVDLLPYFFPAESVMSKYNESGILTSPGRGSSAGLLLCFLLGITHVDPIETGLSMERFLTLDRIQNGKLPDIDMDLPQKELLVGKVEEYVEVEMEDGSSRKFRKDEKLPTNHGLMTIHEVLKNGAEILEG